MISENDMIQLRRERDVFRRQFLKIRQNYENKIKELSILKELGGALRSANLYDRNTFVRNQLEIVKRYTGIDALALMLLNEQEQYLEVISGEDSFQAADSGNIPAHEGIPGRVITEGEPVVGTMGRKGSEDAVSRLYVPVIDNRQTIGVLYLVRSGDEGFDQNEIRFFCLLGDHMATAVILSRLYNQMLREENRRLLLSRFFPKSVSDKILNSKGKLRLGGERKYATILFVDLHGFTSLSETLEQEKVVEILNAYFSHMTPIIFDNGGTLDKLMGDGMMAIFGAPISHEDDPLRAVRTAVQMMTALDDFNDRHGRENWPRLEMTVGGNAGEVVAGYMGSEDHLNYTVIGDAVNVAQRLQSIAEPGEILVSRTVYDPIRERLREIEGFSRAVCLPPRKLKGKEKVIEVFRLEIL